MSQMSNEEFRNQIKQWLTLIHQAGLTLPNGNQVPERFFHVFLGVGYSTYKKMVSGKDSIRAIQPYTAKTMHYLTLLPTGVFLDEVRKAMPEYLTQHPV